MTFRLWISLLLVVIATHARGAAQDGAWLNDPAKLSLALLPRDFTPNFLIVKIGAFATNGALKSDFVYSSLVESCGKPAETQGWVTHKLKKDERLTPEAGRKLGDGLALLLKDTCFTSIELNIEPMPDLPEWMEPFLAAIRSKLPAVYRLRLAIPPVTTRKIPALSWKPEAARKVLGWLDGLDILVYDSGPKTVPEYELLIDDVIDFLSSVASTGKELILGLPTYRDGDRYRHPVYIENLIVARAALQKLPKEKARVLCNERVRLAYYASWTMEEKDRLVARDIATWRTELCKKK